LRFRGHEEQRPVDPKKSSPVLREYQMKRIENASDGAAITMPGTGADAAAHYLSEPRA
jgi:hypothetical protein